MTRFRPAILALSLTACATAAQAQTHPIALDEQLTLAPIIDVRLRWEDVDATSRDAHAESLRLRAGAELAHKPSHLSLLIEGSGTTHFGSGFSGFSYATPSDQYRPHRATIADGSTVALNRLQLRYATKPLTATVGRQRIILDDQRFVGNAPWRQTEQTFDAARIQTTLGPLVLDATHAIRQNTVNGSDGAPRDHLRGDFTFVTGGIVTKPATLKGFAYLLDYDATPFLNQPGARSQLDSSQTYGLRTTTTLPLGHHASLALAGSLAWQSSYGRNPNAYAATYSSIEPALTLGQHTLTLTREVLGADAKARNGAWSFQTPLSSLHKFNGWADMFLTTPANGLRDHAVTLTGKLPKIDALPRVTYTVAHHWFDADLGGAHYGKEINASLGFSTKPINWLLKFAQYEARGFATDTRKIWVQAEFVF
ncbi:alginate export family protein [Novosphingobium terrae]|uniref:alginate export family protein n=1 Tax=Novosphingobium terrae TaxID=2726189 RepID=UPI00197D3B8E|nr:alginate export family protein [Novosphingobium terrae]